MDLGFVIRGMDIGLHVMFLLRRRPCRAVAQPVVAGQSGVVYALATVVSTASTRMRFLVLVACSNFTFPVMVANTV